MKKVTREKIRYKIRLKVRTFILHGSTYKNRVDKAFDNPFPTNPGMVFIGNKPKSNHPPSKHRLKVSVITPHTHADFFSPG